MEFKYSTTWNWNIPLHGIQEFYYMEFKYSTTWNLNWLNGFENSTTWNLWFHLVQIRNLKQIWQTQYQVLEFYLFFIHTVGSISKYEIEIMVSYSITHMPFLCSIAIWLCSDQYRFCLFQKRTTFKKISDLKGRMNRETERKINSQELQKLY